MKGDPVQVQNYLFFDGRCDEAIEFYGKAVGAEVTMRLTFGQSPVPVDQGRMPEANANKVMHAQMRIGDTEVMCSDGHCTGNAKFEGFSLAITVDKEADADKYFNALTQGGKVLMPLDKTFFSPRYGMCTDKFGVMWMVMVRGQ